MYILPLEKPEKERFLQRFFGQKGGKIYAKENM
jgi:hypothetical protein